MLADEEADRSKPLPDQRAATNPGPTGPAESVRRPRKV